MLQFRVWEERWPIRGVFRIARGARTESRVVVVEVSDGSATGRGECVPYPRYGETVEGVLAEVERIGPTLGGAPDRNRLGREWPAGGARNAVDGALWDLEAKRAGVRAWELAGVPAPGPLTTAYTISLDTPAGMGAAAAAEAERPLLKLKLTGDGDVERVAAVRAAAPATRIIADANEAWSPAQYRAIVPALVDLGVELIEQPFPSADDAALRDVDRPIPVAADESCHTSVDVHVLADRYDVVNIKLDKTGGLTEALRVLAVARDAGLGIMVGCMVGTSLGVAPATLLGWAARYVDLDAPLLLAKDRPEGLRFDGSVLYPPDVELWG
jgi:L-alanine-DL-glutamate epimerase-like enolase superfamily enzyme